MNATTTATAIEPFAEAYLRVQAQELLGIAPDASAAEQLRATLEFLDGCDGDVTSAQFDAIELLHGSATEQDLISGIRLSSLRDELEVKLGEDIEQFTGQFFDLPPAARSSAWDSLYKRSEFSIAWRRRLEGLQPGLLVEPPQLEAIVDEQQKKLVRSQLALFRLRPTARGPLLTAARQEMSQAPHEWSAAIGRFAKIYPDIAKLVPELIELGDSLDRDSRAAKKPANKQRNATRRQSWSKWWSSAKPTPWVLLGVFVAVALLLIIFPANSPDEERVQEALVRIRALQDAKKEQRASDSQAPADAPVAEGHDPDAPIPSPLPPDEPQIDPPAAGNGI